MIDDLLKNLTFFNETVIPAYNSVKRKQIYEESLKNCKVRFPQYVQELEGIAEGSETPFYKLFLLHIESVLCPPISEPSKGATGCTSVIVNKVGDDGGVFLGHTEDAMIEFGNNVYIVSVEIIDESSAAGAGQEQILEKFTTLTYAGHLPGYTMGFNSHFIYSINTEFPVQVRPELIPRAFLTRAILGASVSTIDQIQEILRNPGFGVSDGFSLNIIFRKTETMTSGAFNIEVAPPTADLKVEQIESQLNMHQISSNDVYAHCNKYLRLSCKEYEDCASYSIHRHATLQQYTNTAARIDLEVLKKILSDRQDKQFPIFRSCGSNDCPVKTVAVGIFNVSENTWSIFMGPPTNTRPIAILYMER